MRRCYRGAALILGSVFLASNSIAVGSVFLAMNAHSCSGSLTALNVYAAEAALPKEVIELPVTGSLSTEQNVETEIPAEETDPEPIMGAEENNQIKIHLKPEELKILHKIVEAEAGNEDMTGKMLIANVILNRVNSDRFPDTIKEVVYQRQHGKVQFSPTIDGRLDSVKVTQETVDAVDRVLHGEDNSNGALYFRSVKSTGTWHDRALIRLSAHGNHIFYTL